MIQSLKKILQKEFFEPKILGLLINPFYIARRGLYLAIKKNSHFITGKTLDAGCGRKPYEHFFSSTQYIGMAIEQSGHDHAKSKIDVFYDGKSFPFPANEFDSVVTNQTLEHVFEPEVFLAEINRVLKPNGTLLLTVPFVWDEHEQPYDYARYSSFGIKYLLNKCGFEIIHQQKIANNAGMIFQLINAYIYKVLAGNGNVFGKVISRFFTFPFNLIGMLFSVILPRNNDLYLDIIILAKKK